MKNKYLLVLIFVLSIVAVVSSRDKTASFFDEDNSQALINVYDPDTSSVQDMDLEEYVVGVVAAEMPASFHEEALKAQAIAARSYALYKMEHAKGKFDVIADISNQAFIDEEKMRVKWGDDFEYYYERVKKCVEATKGQVMRYDGNVIEAFYFAMSNGSTEDSALVFGEKINYLAAVDSSWDENVGNFLVINTISKNDFCKKLSIDCKTIEITDIKKSSSGRVNTININGKTFKGTEVRQLLGLRSTDFTIELGTDIEITTKGYGHGVGMSQYGANEMAKLGKTYEEILNHYYQNIEINGKSV